jgi:hypothetical protein
VSPGPDAHGEDVGAYAVLWNKVGRLSPALPGPALLLLVAFGCNVMTTRFGQGDQRGAMTKEAPMKVTEKVRSREIIKVTTIGFLTTVANVAAAFAAATSG